MKTVKLTKLNPTHWKKLKKQAKSARTNAYAPYSGCKIGAALLTKSGKIVAGCNVENASYGATICAERTAISAAVSQGLKTEGGFSFVAAAICSDASPPWAPCGICRQVLTEFADPETFEILLFNLEGKEEHCTLSELFPYAFSPMDLPKGRKGLSKKNRAKMKAARKKNLQVRLSLQSKEVSGTL